jgi:hypothetical protein
MNTVNNRPLDGEGLVTPVQGFAGETNYIGTEAFINFLESLNSSYNSTELMLNATARAMGNPGAQAKATNEISRVESSMNQQIGALFAMMGRIEKQLQIMNQRIQQVEALCLSNLVR